jgi:hypothetical protein
MRGDLDASGRKGMSRVEHLRKVHRDFSLKTLKEDNF